ncbi:MAG: AbrB/MazE/SpoVT family DNA-binding domain-containing protein [Candidatus Acetothermia bacterium]|jgi:AbrB family looped-hinge helix DNA binding protein|nr:AbrB/MazE/SpoVT family DNA-binding domain-containing protein [Candidatus Acetothermia bacterium]MDH7505674.1 AbrB/MazE/SpoVT family DNA-binding domain-containing protein [Candidatus Acetothermia bacterium]
MAFLKRTLRVGAKGQITLPQEIRQDLEIRRGDFINIYKLDENLYILERMSPIRELSRSIAAEAEAEGYSEEEVRERVDRVKEELLREVYRTYPTTGTR